MLPYLTIFGYRLPSFGFMMLLGMLAAFLLIFRNIRHTDIDEDDFYSVAIVAIVCGMLGAKLLYWLVEIKTVIAYPRFLLETLTSGFVFYGGLIGGALGITAYSRYNHRSPLRYTDLICPSFAIGQALGRIGCFLAGCCYGAPTTSAIGVIYPDIAETAAPSGIPLLPTQLMESVFLIFLSAFLTGMFRKQRKQGTTTAWYFILYGIWRFIIEFFRSDERGAILGLSTSQFIGIFVIVAGIAILIVSKSHRTTSDGSKVSRETSRTVPVEPDIVEVTIDPTTNKNENQ
ncbi:MAG: prolipoprotein diacylglyceryl transferase [Clostridia bacterium]|nr:prolipoprotein diacylglyceryl transferase [Clostridia bacterium]